MSEISRASLSSAIDALESAAALGDNLLKKGLDYAEVGRAIGKARAALMFFKPEAQSALEQMLPVKEETV